ncbi:hemophore-related protein [Mycobacteroides chelonae]|jgi:hypothetical protein|uniref:Secreted protein n=1 Tax=Mycobacteroides chelonae TaxID=1774 RepID=A0AB73M2I0_MYCCH|nr:hemophore-related protein [Mycobacteroides chelonae]MBF9327721.1 hypothetical protein [Mycobacteroides chelonae]MBF9421899.1 hypothetical protein [Mycobacteroides chelonae]MBF9435912.1 hypothetical protein [Mycobacteroides chelonae]MBV6361812.1 hypothetical protein [Mycobacteroides chelonae]MEC4837557.1 hemophore-related protein [Mycobacteroides chelonae]
MSPSAPSSATHAPGATTPSTTAATDRPETATSAAPTTPGTSPKPAPSAGNEPGRKEATKPGHDDSDLYTRHQWRYPWRWWRDLAWDSAYPYDWPNSGYWNYWYPTWTNTCPYRCPTNDNGPYPPDVQNYLDAHPDLAAEFARVHGFPWELRRGEIQPFLNEHPDYLAWFNDRQPWI